MELYKEAREAQEMVFDREGVEVFIERTGYIRDGGGRKEVDDTVGPLTMILCPKKGTDIVVSTETGVKESKDWTGTAKYDADVQSGSDVKDIVKSEMYGDFEVKDVTPRVLNNKVISYSLELEKVI